MNSIALLSLYTFTFVILNCWTVYYRVVFDFHEPEDNCLFYAFIMNNKSSFEFLRGFQSGDTVKWCMLHLDFSESEDNFLYYTLYAFITTSKVLWNFHAALNQATL